VTKAVEIPVPVDVRDLRLLDRFDYADAFAVDAMSTRTPERWMRDFLQDAPRWFQVPWKAGLGTAVLGLPLRLTSTANDVLGWTILLNTPRVIVVGLSSPRGVEARLIATTPPGRVVITTLAQFDTAYARTLWPPIRRLHRYFVPYLLTRAADHPTEPSRRAGPTNRALVQR
jgi:hypothetical protein